MAEGELELVVWGATAALPLGLDPASLALQAYVRFSGRQEELRLAECTGGLDVLREPVPCLRELGGRSPDSGSGSSKRTVVARSVPAIVDRLRAKGFNIDQHLSAKQASDSLAFATYAETALQPALLHHVWLTEDGQTNVSQGYCSSRLQIPLNYVCPRLYRDRVKEANGGLSDKQLQANSTRCLQALETRLGASEPFFFGDRPTYLDAVVFGYLGLLRSLPSLGSDMLDKALPIDTCPNLLRWCKRVEASYFADCNLGPPGAASSARVQPSAYSMSRETQRRQTNLLFGGAAAALLCLYAWRIELPSRVLGMLRGDR